MASYTDKIPTFNPYVAQQPVDAMLKVGMYKQQKYEEGVKRIQNSIDNVSGLDIANPVQQKYLQSKLNSLGNNLTFLAASDFSDFSLVNSVNGMTKEIVKDEDVINAVSSTAKMRAGYKKREELAKKGLTDKNNDDYYDKFVGDYINSTDLKARFNSDYVPYTNIVKKLQAALVGAGETSVTAEQLFVTDPNTGKPLIGPDGHYQYADVKTIDKLVSNKPAVLAAISNVMSEGDVRQQLGIDGWAKYKDTEATTLLEPLKTEYDNERSRLEGQSLEITAMLNSTNLSPEQREMYTKANSELEAALSNNDNTFLSLSEQAENNPEEFKQNYYAQEFKQNLVTQFTKTEESHTTGVNEGLQQQNYRDDVAFKKEQERNKIAYQNESLKVTKSGDQREWMKFYADYEQDPVTGQFNKKPEAGKKGAGGTYDANKPLFSGGTPGDKVNARNIVEEDINKLTVDKNSMAFSIYADFYRTYKDNPSMDDKDILASVKIFAKQKGITPEAYLDRYASNIKNNYDLNGLTPPPNLNDEFNTYITTSSNLTNKMNLFQRANKDAQEEAGVKNALNDLLKDKNTLNFNLEGQKFTVTPQDMLEMIKSGWMDRLALGYASGNTRKFIVDDKSLTAKQNNFLSNWYNLTPDMRKQVLKEYGSYGGKQSSYYGSLDKANEIFNEKLSKIVGVTDVVTGALPMDSDSKPETIGMVATYVNGGERNYGSGVDKETVLKALDNAKTISWKGKKPTNSREDWIGEIIINDENGKSYAITNVNRKDLSTFTNAKFTNYVEKPIQDAINMNPKTKSTNPVYMPNSPNAWRTAYFKSNKVNPEVTKAGWAYRADVVPATNGGYRLVNYVRPPGSNAFVTIYGAAAASDEGIIDNTFKTTTPAQLNAMYLNYLHNQTQNKQ